MEDAVLPRPPVADAGRGREPAMVSSTATQHHLHDTEARGEPSPRNASRSEPRSWFRRLARLIDDIFYAHYVTSYREAGDYATARRLDQERRRHRCRGHEETCA